ncbi:PKD domain-containing protein [Halorientalis halophila]|uniref:PKD domain-containing protein n=1 Tax=Halorientalis halophila TaxID=3108499 RepID=UPI00300AE2F3
MASLALSGVAAGAGNEPPLADAGLDQAVAANETVRLDATGSRDPDGNVTAYQWEIETPDGRTVAPDCPTCGTTSFRPTMPGRYNVTVTVTDDDNATASDTLYLRAEAVAGPTVSLSGPTSPSVDQPVYGDEFSDTVPYAANLSSGGYPIDRVEWLVDGQQVDQMSVDGSAPGTVQFNHTIENESQRTLTARVVDVSGRVATDSLSVTPNAVRASTGSAGGDDDGETWMQGEFAGQDVSYRPPTLDTETGEIVRRADPTEEEYMNIADARPGEEVQTRFGGDDEDDNENTGSNNDNPKDGINQITDTVNTGFGFETDPLGGSNDENEQIDTDDIFGGI